MYNEYRFVDRLFVPAPLDDTYEVVGDTLGYPSWWGDVFVRVEGDDGPPRPGRHVEIVSRGLLPYRLRWEAEVVEAEAPHRFDFTMTGDFVGGGSWTSSRPTAARTRSSSSDRASRSPASSSSARS